MKDVVSIRHQKFTDSVLLFLIHLFVGFLVCFCQGGFFLHSFFEEIAVTYVHSAFYEQRESSQQEKHLEGREVCHLHALQIVANHIAGPEQQVAYAVPHASVAESPDVDEKQECGLE